MSKICINELDELVGEVKCLSEILTSLADRRNTAAFDLSSETLYGLSNYAKRIYHDMEAIITKKDDGIEK